MTALNYQVGLIVLLSIVLAVLLVNAWIQRRQLKTLLNELSKLNHTFGLYGDTVKALGARLQQLESQYSVTRTVSGDERQRDETAKSIDNARMLLAQGLSVSEVAARASMSEAEIELLQQMEQADA